MIDDPSRLRLRRSVDYLGGSDAAEALASTLDWWALAGVDAVVEDAPRNWLAPRRPDPAAAPPAAAPAAPAAPVETSLAAFQGRLLTGAFPVPLPPSGRIAPSGDPASGLMVLVDMPEMEDRTALLEGAAGRLLDHMLAAIGWDRSRLYLASVLPARTPAGRVPAEAAPALAALTRAHVDLAAPRRLLVLGDLASRMALGAETAATRGRWHEIGDTRAISSFHPRTLIGTPAMKAGAWADLRMIIEETPC